MDSSLIIVKLEIYSEEIPEYENKFTVEVDNLIDSINIRSNMKLKKNTAIAYKQKSELFFNWFKENKAVNIDDFEEINLVEFLNYYCDSK